MRSPNLKMLTSSFLALALFASVAVHALNSAIEAHSSPEIPYEPTLAEIIVKEGAFSEFSTTDIPGTGTPASVLALTSSGNYSNLTESIKDGIMQELITANIEDLASGKTENLKIPSEKKLEALLAKNLNSFELTELNANLPSKPRNIVSAQSDADQTRYLKEVDRLTNQALDDEIISAMLSSSGPDGISEARGAFQDLTKSYDDLPVPENFSNLHIALLRYSIRQANALDAVEKNFEEDPLKALLAAQSAAAMARSDIDRIETELGKLGFIGANLKQEKNNAVISLLNSLLGIRRAHAAAASKAVPVDSPPVVAPYTFGDRLQKWLQTLNEWLNKMSVPFLKDEFLTKINDSVVKWVKNAGDPRFITNWRAHLTSKFDKGKLEAIGQTLPRMCDSMRPLLEKTFGKGISPSNPLASKLGKLVECPTKAFDMSKFYKDFSRGGGWSAYAESFKETGNLWGAFMALSDIATREAAAESGVAEAESVASAGYKGVTECVKKNADGSCDEETVRTPGKTVGQTVEKTVISSDAQKNANLNDVSNVIESALRKIASKYIDKYLNSKAGLLGL